MVTGFDLLHENKPLQKHWIKRVVAYLIDFLVSSLIIYAPFYLIIDFRILAPAMIWYFPMIAGMIQVFYSAVLEYFTRKTIGKAVMNLSVEQLTQKFDMSEALIRNFSKINGILILFDWVAGMASEGDPRQRYLDRVSETTVRGAGEPIHVKEFIDEHLFEEEEKEEEEVEKEEKRCRECGGKLKEIGEDRYRCTNCGRIQ